MLRYSIPANQMSATLGQTVSDIRERMAATSSEATTGRRADLTLHLSGRIGKAMLSQKALNDVTSQRDMLTLRGERLDLGQQALGRVQDSVAGVATDMLSALGADHETGIATAARDARAALDAAFSALNVRHGERYLFSGDATASVPFPDTDQLLADVRQIAINATDAADFEAQIDTYINDPAGGWQQTIYQGTATASDNESVPGTDPAITKLISGLAVLAASGPENGVALLKTENSVIHSATVRLSEGETELTRLRADKGVNQQRIADDLSALDTEETILNEAFNKIAGRDQYEAATELRELENTLEASYLLTARLSNLSLLNYLR